MNAANLRLAEQRLAARDLPGAIHAFNSAEAAGAGADVCAAGRWRAHMLAGDFKRAWSESDAIRRRGAPDPNRLWLGDDIQNKRVILRCLHGFGDAVQFLRYAPMLTTLASDLVVEVPPRMLEIAGCFDGVERAITWGEQAPPSSTFDLQVELMELPYLFRTSMEDLPVATGYLKMPPAAARRAQAAMGRSRSTRVGIVWAAGDWNRERSLPPSLLKPLLTTMTCEFWNLQGDRAREDLAECAWASPMRNAALCGDGILALAAVISQLDLVISVDTLAAHLAGALGKPVWLLLQHAADWRWLHGRNDSPWYPSARLYRQPEPGAWKSVVQAVQRDLARLIPVEQVSCRVAQGERTFA